MWSSGLSFGLARALEARLGRTRWIDVTGLVDQLRHVTSAAEQASDFFLSNTVLLGDAGPEVLTRTPMTVNVR